MNFQKIQLSMNLLMNFIKTLLSLVKVLRNVHLC